VDSAPSPGSAERALAEHRYDEALAAAQRFLDGVPDGSAEARAMHRLAMQAAFYLHDADAARRHGLAALRMAQERGDPLDTARAHNDLAVVAGADMLFPEALDHLWQAVHLREEAGADADPATLNNLANVYLLLERHEEAIGLLVLAEERFRDAGDDGSAAMARANLGRAYADADRPHQAIPALDAALETFERLGRAGDVAATHAKLGVAHGRAGAAGRAREAFERALAIHADGHGTRFEAETRQWYGAWALEEGDAATALAQLEAAAGRYGEAQRARSGVLEPLSRGLEAAGRLEEALDTLRAYVAGQEELRSVASDASARVRLLELEAGLDGDQEVARRHAVDLQRRNAELRAHAERLAQLSVTDQLTGLPNRRALDRRLREEVVRAQRHGEPLTMALLDLDRFKSVNDGFSHDVGDRVLARVARLLRLALRRSDVAARWGGEEFALLLPATTAEEANAVLERVRAAIAEHRWSQLAPGLTLTASIGAAELAEAGEAPALLRLADRRLYDAKHGGRDRIVGRD
jgi:diguanylate cyclase (GGDEF)-like protein